MYWVYIIYSAKLDRYYVGYTEEIQKRLTEHNTGISTFTAKADDWIVKYSKQYNSRQEAHEAELVIKKKKSRKYIEWLIAVG
jgi:putative endonuclease